MFEAIPPGTEKPIEPLRKEAGGTPVIAGVQAGSSIDAHVSERKKDARSFVGSEQHGKPTEEKELLPLDTFIGRNVNTVDTAGGGSYPPKRQGIDIKI